jgi:hypothetical protein
MHPTSVSLILFLILIAVLLGFGHPIIPGLWLRFRIRRRIKMLAARTARHQKRFSEADQFLRQALDVCNQTPKHWKMKTVNLLGTGFALLRTGQSSRSREVSPR